MATNDQQSSSTEQFVDIESVKDGVVILKGGGLRQVIIVTGINFDLKSEEEQNLILYSYQNMLNTLDFSLQFFVHSRKLNIDQYLNMVQQRFEEEPDSLLKDQIAEYKSFIKSFVEENAVMAKTFFVVVPYDYFEVSHAVKSFKTSKFLPFSSYRNNEADPKTAKSENREANLAKALAQLKQRVDQVISGLSAIGLRAVTLNTEETLELFYNLYNPSAIEKSGIAILKEN